MFGTEGSVLVAVHRIERYKRMEAARGLAVFWDHRLTILGEVARVSRYICSRSEF